MVPPSFWVPYLKITNKRLYWPWRVSHDITPFLLLAPGKPGRQGEYRP